MSNDSLTLGSPASASQRQLGTKHQHNDLRDSAATRGKQAIDLNKATDDWAGWTEEVQAQEEKSEEVGDVNVLSIAKCYICKFNFLGRPF